MATAIQSKKRGLFENPDRLVTLPEACALIGVKQDTLRKAIQSGRLRAKKMGEHPQSRFRILVRDLEDMLSDAYPNREMLVDNS